MASDEFVFVECGILAHGFLRLRCGACRHDERVAFSCKGRSCPSCGARCVAPKTAHPVDQLIPQVPRRQWMPSMPIPVRLPLTAQAEQVTRVGVQRRDVLLQPSLGTSQCNAVQGKVDLAEPRLDVLANVVR